jgi:colicin import membrane protein
MNAPQKDLVDLVVIEPKDALATFTTPGALEPILALVRARIDAFEGDATTEDGRAKIKSMAHAISRSKTALESVGERLAKEAKELPKKIDASRKLVKDTLDAWRDEVRKPVTDWEKADDERKDRHGSELNALKDFVTCPAGDAASIRAQIAIVNEISDGKDREEFQDGFRLAKANALTALRDKLATRENYDADQAELAKLRAEQAKRDAEEAERKRIEQAAAEAKRIADGIEQAKAIAADNARRDAERKAQAEREAVERRAQEERDRAIEREAELRAQAEAAERRERETEARLKREAEEKAAAEKAEAARRERDIEHRRKINRAAVDALISGGVSETAATLAVRRIAEGSIPNVKIFY